MIKSTKVRLLVPAIALGWSLAMTVSAQAATRHNQMTSGTSTSLQVNFGSTPRWQTIPGTNVREIRGDLRPEYDMFRYDGNYYAYNNNRWYRSRWDRGEFMWIEDRYVPSQFTRVPRAHWRNYPSAWTDERGNSRYGHSRGHGRGKGKGNGSGNYMGNDNDNGRNGRNRDGNGNPH